MERPHRPRGNWRDLLILGVVALVVAADQLTKWWITSNLGDGEVLWDIGFLRIINIHNTGAAFGIFRGNNLIFIVVYSVFFLVIVGLIFRFHNHRLFARSLLARLVAGLVIGGMLGNYIDRIRIGHVTDFIDFKVWPAFNVADSSLTISLVIIVVYIIFNWNTLSRLGE